MPIHPTAARASVADALAHAIALAAEGIASFPCGTNKAPATPHGFRDGTADARALRELWRLHPGELIGAVTGAASDLDALDIDAKHAEARAWWKQNLSQLPRTRVHRTRAGGLHLLFRHAPNIRCSAGRIARGVDVRGDGGYIIWWPAAGLPVLADGPIAEWPAWLLPALLPPPAPAVAAGRPWSAPPISGGRARRYAVAALRRAVQRVAGAPAGARNDALNRETHSLARLIANDALSPREVAEAMAHAALAAGLPALETERTIASALAAGAAP